MSVFQSPNQPARTLGRRHYGRRNERLHLVETHHSRRNQIHRVDHRRRPSPSRVRCPPRRLKIQIKFHVKPSSARTPSNTPQRFHTSGPVLLLIYSATISCSNIVSCFNPCGF